VRKRTASEPIAQVLSGLLLRVQQEQRPLFLIQQAWPKVVGRRLAAHAKPVSFRRGRLVVAVDRPGESFALTFKRVDVVAQLNQLVEGAVHEMVIRPGNPPQPKT